MSILARFTPKDLTKAQYDEVNRKLEEAGHVPPDGQQVHVCFGEEGDLRISEIWESEEKMRAFGEKLMPILEEVGIEAAAQPELLPVVAFYTH